MTTSTAVKKRLTSERTMEQMEYFMEHIMQRHVQPLQYRGNSFFLSTNKQYIRAMVTQTMKNPDVVLPHKYNKNRAVKKKTFSKQVGVHGIFKAPCYCVTVIFPWDKLTLDNSNLQKFRNRLVRMPITFTPLNKLTLPDKLFARILITQQASHKSVISLKGTMTASGLQNKSSLI